MAVVRSNISVKSSVVTNNITSTKIIKQTSPVISGANYAIYDIGIKMVEIPIPAKTYIDKIDLNILSKYNNSLTISVDKKTISADLYDQTNLGIYSILIGKYFPVTTSMVITTSATIGSGIITILKGMK